AGIAAGVLGVLGLVALNGFVIVQPNQAKVAIFLGRYVGTVRRSGFHWVNPLTTRRTLSLRIRNLDTDELKVNDANGNPIEISAVIVWQVTDAAQAAFDVEDYEAFVAIQAETAVRHVASVFPYDSYEEGQESLRGAADRVIATLQADLQERLDVAGVTVLDTRLRRLAYAPEIAADMLRRQQADAIVAARQRIVEGAVGMVDHALSSLNERDIVELDEERKAAMVSNLMVVLVSDRGAQPVVNSGSLYT
ncbi:MAG TPA: SPFH domain-containing protein, partial [Actinomycetes bacterium]|nr:SPFH domain-containing protein [Actinomycetes bacterium]